MPRNDRELESRTIDSSSLGPVDAAGGHVAMPGADLRRVRRKPQLLLAFPQRLLDAFPLRHVAEVHREPALGRRVQIHFEPATQIGPPLFEADRDIFRNTSPHVQLGEGAHHSGRLAPVVLPQQFGSRFVQTPLGLCVDICKYPVLV